MASLKSYSLFEEKYIKNLEHYDNNITDYLV